MDPKKELPQTIFATILLAFISTVLCFLTGVGLVGFNWTNPVWDNRVRIIFLVGTLFFLALAVLLGILLRKRSN